MNPLIREMKDRGLEPLLVESKEVIGQARIRYGHNDVIIFALVETDGTIDVRSCTREEGLATMRERFPDASSAIAILEKPLPPTQFALITFDLCDEEELRIYSVVLRLNGTLGVLN